MLAFRAGAAPERTIIADGHVRLRLEPASPRASCFVLASLPTPFWEEQFGLVLAEAAASGLPIVAAASGAIPEVLNGHGRLFPPGDWHALAGELDAIVGHAPARASYGDLVERYSVEAAAARYGAAYDRVLASA